MNGIQSWSALPLRLFVQLADSDSCPSRLPWGRDIRSLHSVWEAYVDRT